MKAKIFCDYVSVDNRKQINIFLNDDKNLLYTPFDSRGKLAIHLAAARGFKDLAFHLLCMDPSLLNKPDDLNRRVLHFAALNGHEELLDNWLREGADSNVVDKDGKTALDYAKNKGHKGCVKSLVRIKIENVLNENRPELIYALIDKLHNEQLLDLDSQVQLLQGFIKLGYLEPLNYLIEKTQNFSLVNQKGARKESPLHLAILYGQVEILKYLLAQGATLNMASLYEETATVDNGNSAPSAQVIYLRLLNFFLVPTPIILIIC